MPVPIVIGFFAYLLVYIVPFVKHVLIAFGIGAVTYIGVGSLIDNLEIYLINSFNGLPIFILDWLTYVRLDDAITVIISGMTMRVTLAGLNAVGGITKTRMTLPA